MHDDTTGTTAIGNLTVSEWSYDTILEEDWHDFFTPVATDVRGVIR